MKLIPVVLVTGLFLITAGCAHMRHPAACCEASAPDVARGHGIKYKHDLFSEAKISAKHELGRLMLTDLNEQQKESLADIWLPVHQHEAENTAKLMELTAAIKDIKSAEKLDTDKIESLYDQMAEIQQKSAKENAQAINKMRAAVPGDKGWSTRAIGYIPMMDNILWCIEFCSGQADVLCAGGADLKCWRKRFLQCAAMCYR